MKDKSFRGYNASKREYYYGFKIHVVCASDGTIVEFEFSPASWHDLRGLALLGLDLPEGSELFLDRAYNDYALEELAREAAGIHLRPVRKKNSKAADYTRAENDRRNRMRKPVETHLSQLMALFPRKLHATTLKGFILKMMGLVVAYSFTVLAKAL